MAKMHVVGRASEAKVRALRVNAENQADLLWCEVEKDYLAKGDALWYFADRADAKTCALFWVDQEHLSNIKVFKVSQPHQAKWKKSHALRERLG